MKVRAKNDCVIGRRYLRAGEIADIDWPKDVRLPEALEDIGKAAKGKAEKSKTDAGDAAVAEPRVKI